MANGRTDRSCRIAERKSGGWGSSSQDLLYLAARLFRLSRDESSSRPDRNNSRFVYAGIPLLLGSTYSFAIEYEGFMNLCPVPTELIKDNLVRIMKERYGVSGDLLQDLRDLVQIRHEIIHPIPLPVGTRDNWPNYLRRVKEKGLLNTSGDPNADYILLGQIASHRLFTWAVEVTKSLYVAIINSNPAKAPACLPFLGNFNTFYG